MSKMNIVTIWKFLEFMLISNAPTPGQRWMANALSLGHGKLVNPPPYPGEGTLGDSLDTSIRDSKVRVARDHGKKFRSKLAAPFSGIVHFGASLIKLTMHIAALTHFVMPFSLTDCQNASKLWSIVISFVPWLEWNKTWQKQQKSKCKLNRYVTRQVIKIDSLFLADFCRFSKQSF